MTTETERVKDWLDNSQEFQAGVMFGYLTVLELIKKMNPERDNYNLQAVALHVGRLTLEVGGK